MLLFFRCSAWRGSHEMSHASRLVREAASRLMCSRKGHILNFFQQWAYKRSTWKGQQSGTDGVLTCNQHDVDVTAGLQVLIQCGSPVVFKERVMTCHYSVASWLMRETDSRLMRPREDHSLKHVEHRQCTTAVFCNRNTDEHLCRPTSAVVHWPPSERSLVGFRTVLS